MLYFPRFHLPISFILQDILVSVWNFIALQQARFLPEICTTIPKYTSQTQAQTMYYFEQQAKKV